MWGLPDNDLTDRGLRSFRTLFLRSQRSEKRVHRLAEHYAHYKRFSAHKEENAKSKRKNLDFGLTCLVSGSNRRFLLDFFRAFALSSLYLQSPSRDCYASL